MKSVPKKYLYRILRDALKEDLGKHGDITSESVFARNFDVSAHIVAKEKGIVCGTKIIVLLAELVSKKLKASIKISDGRRVNKGQTIGIVRGPIKSVLKMERVCLNFIGRLSGIATLTHEFVSKTKKYKVKILDTRKTTPYLRHLEKYAVSCGGGVNHRFGLFDMVLIKDNHVWGWKYGVNVAKNPETLQDLVKAVRKKVGPSIKIEVEVDRLDQLEDVLFGEPDIILLDNMSLVQLRKSVTLMQKTCKENRLKKPLLEASGGVDLKTVSLIAQTGVDCISIGALTHSARNFNYSLELMK